MSFIKVLMVAEKPSIADVLARSLSGGRSFKGDSRIPLHEYRGTFMGQDAAFSVTSVMGHVFRCADSDRWRLLLRRVGCNLPEHFAALISSQNGIEIGTR